ncbi:MAG TPA: hypothetical protein DCO65_02385 [Spartobacteria bacterium]|jgi:hypothetical protein|nr:hypothetical protein [Spartobacteria bacterium]
MLTNIILEGAPRDPKLACWLLEKLYPGEYGRDVRDGPVESPLPPISDKEMSEILDSIAASQKQIEAARNANYG